MHICLGYNVDVECGDGFIRAAQEQTSHFHSLALIKLSEIVWNRLMVFLLPSNLTFQKQLMATSATHLWLANLKHHKRFGGWRTVGMWAGWEPRLVQLCTIKVKAQFVVLTIFMCKTLMTPDICSKAVLNTKRLNLLQGHVWAPRISLCATGQDDAAAT